MKSFVNAAAAALAVLAAPAFAQGQAAPRSGEARDNILAVRGDDPEMNAAIARSRAELAAFYARMANPGAGETRFLVKFDIVPGSEAEFVWAGDLDRSTSPMTGILLNQPALTQHRVGQRVPITEDAVIDWTYRRGSVTQGGYTQRVVIGRLPPDEAARVRAYMGW
jgi:uncharacterized protein YegJ (DUF2314 family)